MDPDQPAKRLGSLGEKKAVVTGSLLGRSGDALRAFKRGPVACWGSIGVDTEALRQALVKVGCCSAWRLVASLIGRYTSGFGLADSDKVQ